MSIVHTISSSDNESEEESDLLSRLKKKFQIEWKSTELQKEKSNLKTNEKKYKENNNLDNLPNINHSEDEDELPNIEDVSLIQPQNHILENDPVNTSPGYLPAANTGVNTLAESGDERKCRKNTKRKERETKKEEREYIKQQKLNERMMKKATKPGECHKYMLAKLDRRLCEQPEGREIINKLASIDSKYEVTEQLIPYSITFFRQDIFTNSEIDEKECIVITPIEDFLQLVHHQIYAENSNKLSTKCHQWKTLTQGADITLVVCGLDEYYKTGLHKDGVRKAPNENSKKNKLSKSAKDSPHTKVLRVDVETALVTIQIEEGVNSRMFSTPAKVGEFVGQMVKAVAERPNKFNKEKNDFLWYAEGSNTNCVKVDKVGTGLLKLWHQQLQQFSLVGPETAQAIVKEYPSPQSLIQAYRKLPSNEATRLLVDIPVRRGVGILANTRKVGIELSKNIYTFFTENDPSVYL